MVEPRETKVDPAQGRLIWSLLLLVLFYAIGVIVFYTLERQTELQTYAENRALYQKMRELYSFKHCEDPAFQRLSFCKSQKEFSASLKEYFNKHGNSVEDLGQWTILGCIFFLTHLSTTIGYGNAHAQTSLGQLATIVFALVGIPLMGYALAQVARLHLSSSIWVLRRVGSVHVTTGRQMVVLLWFLLAAFLFGGALVFSYLESWSYFEGLYFCFATLSTVGFGDFLPTSVGSKVFSILYIVSGLGVCASIIAVLTGMVASGHGTLSQLWSEGCPDCCGVDGSREKT